MSAQLNLLEKIALVTGELAVLKENGVLALVRVEKITIDPDGLTFTLKPQKGPRIGLETLRAFSIGACLEHLNFAEGRYSCAMVGWTLETDPVKVIYLKNMISRMAKVDEVLKAFRQRHEFYDARTEKAIEGLVRLKGLIKTGKMAFPQDPLFKGQSWGGAGVMVISNDPETVKQYAHFDGETVITNHATLMGELFRKIRRTVSASPRYNHLSKSEFWANLAVAANSMMHDQKVARIEQVCERVVEKAIEFLTQEPCAT